MKDPEEHRTLQILPSDLGEEAEGVLRLVAVWEMGRAECAPLGSISIGRSTDCDLVIDDSRVSRRHAIVTGPPDIEIRDLESGNGTFVNGVRVPSGVAVPLDVGSVIEIGGAVVYLRRPQVAPSTVEASAPAPPTGGGSAMDEVRRAAAVVAKSDISVIILGETGVGKDVLAATIHRESRRASKPFLRLNCAALPDNLLESELFGYEAGAFSGATRTKPGLLQTADTGTVLLDEIGELPLGLQAKLLRVLETGEVTRLGGLKTQRIDVRILAATNRELRTLVNEKRFREDLYFRLEGFSIVIPPLRERADEILPLARSFVATSSRLAERAAPVLSEAAQAALLDFDWPGNVRQLKNAMDRAVLLCTGDVIQPDHLSLASSRSLRAVAIPESLTVPVAAPDLSPSARMELESILAALTDSGGNQTRAARALGISRGTLVKRLELYKVPRPRGPKGEKP